MGDKIGSPTAAGEAIPADHATGGQWAGKEVIAKGESAGRTMRTLRLDTAGRARERWFDYHAPTFLPASYVGPDLVDQRDIFMADDGRSAGEYLGYEGGVVFLHDRSHVCTTDTAKNRFKAYPSRAWQGGDWHAGQMEPGERRAEDGRCYPSGGFTEHPARKGISIHQG